MMLKSVTLKFYFSGPTHPILVATFLTNKKNKFQYYVVDKPELSTSLEFLC